MIRPATLDDVPAIAALGARLHTLSSYSHLSFDPWKVDRLMRDTVRNGVVFVAESADDLVGGLAGGLAEFWFGADTYAFDYALFLAPEHRGGRAAWRLLVAFEAWARLRGAREIRLGITTGIDVEATARLYQAAGYRRAGELFVKEISDGA